jgi:hypothetical protein
MVAIIFSVINLPDSLFLFKMINSGREYRPGEVIYKYNSSSPLPSLMISKSPEVQSTMVEGIFSP